MDHNPLSVIIERDARIDLLEDRLVLLSQEHEAMKAFLLRNSLPWCVMMTMWMFAGFVCAMCMQTSRRARDDEAKRCERSLEAPV